MDIYFFDQKHNNFNFDMVENFLALIDEYKKQGSPVALFKRPIIKDGANLDLPILTYEEIEAMRYTFYGNGFKAILHTYASICDLSEFEEEKFKDITLIDYSSLTIE